MLPQGHFVKGSKWCSLVQRKSNRKLLRKGNQQYRKHFKINGIDTLPLICPFGIIFEKIFFVSDTSLLFFLWWPAPLISVNVHLHCRASYYINTIRSQIATWPYSPYMSIVNYICIQVQKLLHDPTFFYFFSPFSRNEIGRRNVRMNLDGSCSHVHMCRRNNVPNDDLCAHALSDELGCYNEPCSWWSTVCCSILRTLESLCIFTFGKWVI